MPRMKRGNLYNGFNPTPYGDIYNIGKTDKNFNFMEDIKMTITEDKLFCLKLAKEYGHKFLTYTYSTLKEAEENKRGDFGDLFDWHIPEDELYTCCLFDVETGSVIEIKKGKGPLEARKNTMAAYAEFILGDTVDHQIDKSTFGGLQVLTIGQAAATGLPIVSDAKYHMTGEILKRWLNENHLSQNKAAELCAVTPRTFRRWVAGKPIIPQGMWELLRVKVSNSL